MSSFVATGGQSPSQIIIKQPFWPDIDPERFRADMRQDKTTTNERILFALQNAVIDCNSQLATIYATYAIDANAKFSAIAVPQLLNESIIVYKYRRAVFCLAKAELIERYHDYDTTHHGNVKHTDNDHTTADEYKRDATFAIADIKNIVNALNANPNNQATSFARIDVELI